MKLQVPQSHLSASRAGAAHGHRPHLASPAQPQALNWFVLENHWPWLCLPTLTARQYPPASFEDVCH